MPSTIPQTRHTVTAVIVAHDGSRFLPGLVRALRSQTHAVGRIIGVDTGSRDGGGAVLGELIGQDAVFGMDRATGYGQAVWSALRHVPPRRLDETGRPQVEWVWLLHDDCEPAPETLERLLRAASRDRQVVVLGPKVLDGGDHQVLREAGLSIDLAGRRITGIEPGEIDQGQHDANRAVLAVGSAGMLIRRDAWERLGGFDTYLRFFRDDVDFCWRAHGLGFRVHVVTDAVLYHRELVARKGRAAEGMTARRLDRRNALYVLAVNLPLLAMAWTMAGCTAGTLVRAAYYLLTKQSDRAADQAYALGALYLHPVRLWRARRRRAQGLREGYSAVRIFVPHSRTLARLAENVAGLLSGGPPQASAGAHHALVGPAQDAEDEQFAEPRPVARRIIASNGVQLLFALGVIALIAERRLLGAGPLGGGALVPAWSGASGLWAEYLAGFHATGVGSTASAPPYLAVVAALATVLGGSAQLAVDVLLLGCVPLAGLTAYLATRRLTASVPARMWIAAAYALAPVSAGAVASGRLGTAVAFILLPLAASPAARMLTAPPRAARRAAWATGLLVAFAAAFAPLIWLIAAGLAIGWLAAGWLAVRYGGWRPDSRSGSRPVSAVNVAIVVATPFAVLFPWSLRLLASPSAFLTEAGVQPGGLTSAGLRPSALLMLSPGGPGLPPVWVTAGFGLAIAGALLRRRVPLVTAGWAVAAAGFAAALAVSRSMVTPAGDGPAASGWPGPALAVAAAGLLLAAAPAAEWLACGLRAPSGAAADGAGRMAGMRGRLLAYAALAAVATAPVLAAGFWVTGGVRGPVGRVGSPLLPAFVAASSAEGTRYRTLILRDAGGVIDYSVLRQADPSLGEPELAGSNSATAALTRVVGAIAVRDGADAGDPGQLLGEFGIRWVLLPSPVDQGLAQRLDASAGLVPVSSAPAYDLWQVTAQAARVRVLGPGGTLTALPSQTVGMSAVAAPASGGTLVLAEPAGGWAATLNGRALKPLASPVDGWAQGFVLPPGGGQLVISRDNTARDLSLAAELVALLAVCALAVPGKRGDAAAEAAAMEAAAAEAAAAEAAAAEAAAAEAAAALRETARRRTPARHEARGGGASMSVLVARAPTDAEPPGEPADWDEVLAEHDSGAWPVLPGWSPLPGESPPPGGTLPPGEPAAPRDLPAPAPDAGLATGPAPAWATGPSPARGPGAARPREARSRETGADGHTGTDTGSGTRPVAGWTEPGLPGGPNQPRETMPAPPRPSAGPGEPRQAAAAREPAERHSHRAGRHGRPGRRRLGRRGAGGDGAGGAGGAGGHRASDPGASGTNPDGAD